MNKFLITILVLAAALRIYALGAHPVHLTNDEAAIGYNAYSLLKTGRDEHGELFPIIFKSFGDWKPGLYIYATVPFVAVFGLTEQAVRLPSALAGVLAVYLTYKIVLLASKDKKLAALGALLLSITPWHIHFSRGGWEANLALTLVLMGTCKFLLGVKKNSKYLILSATFFGLTLWTYQSAKLASALVVFSLFLAYRKKFLKLNIKHIAYSLLVGLLIAFPIVLSLFQGKGGRLEVMSVFSYTRSPEYLDETVFSQDENHTLGITYYLFHTETLNLTRGVFGRYFNLLSGRFLFFEGDWSTLRHTSPDVGYILLVQSPFLIYGLYLTVKNRQKKLMLFTLLWLALAPLSSALTRDAVHGVRALNMVIPLTIISAVGLNGFINKSKTKLMIASIFISISLVYYLDAYFIHMPAKFSKHYLYGYKQVMQRINEIKSDYDEIVVKQSFDQPYIFYLFFNNVEPKNYQNNIGYIEGVYGDVGKVASFENISFRELNWPLDKETSNTLFIAHEEDFPVYEIYGNSEYKLETINYLDGNPAFLLVEPVKNNE